MAKLKKDIIAELEKLEVEFDEEDTSKNLGELLKKAKKAKEKNPEEMSKPPETPEEGEEEGEKEKGSSVSVYAPNKKYIRTFSKKRHGKEYKAKAKEFAGKVEGRKIKEGGPEKGVKEE